MKKTLIGFGAAMACAYCMVLPVSADIGSVSAVNRDMDGTPPSASVRELSLGDRVVTDELIETSNVGSGQLIFEDQTSLTVAPNSNIVLDKYVYDPATDSGEIALRMTQGAIRFIGGRITKKRDAKITTPLSTIGIRGGIALLIVRPDGTSQVILIAGEYVTIEGKDGSKVTLSRANASAEVGANGTVYFSGLVGPELLAAIFALLEGSGDGGVTLAIVEADTAGIAAINSGVVGGERNEPVSTSGESADEDDSNDSDNPFFSDPRPEDPPPPANTGPTGLPLPASGGVAFLSSGSLFGASGFTFSGVPEEGFRNGSVIAETGSGDVFQISFPDNPDEPGAIPFDTGALNASDTFVQFESSAAPDGTFTLNGTPIEVFGVTDLNPDSPFYAFAYQNEGGGETSNLVGFANGIGEEEYEFEGPPAVAGFGLFGTPFMGQQAIHALDDGSHGELANTVDAFQIVDDYGNGPAPLAGNNIYLVGNAGEPRFDGLVTTQLNPDTPVPSQSGRWLFGALSGETTSSGTTTTFSVLAGPVQTIGNGSPNLSLPVTTITGGEGGFGTFWTTSSTDLGLFEDGDGRTVFGDQGQYIVLSSLSRTQQQGAESGQVTELGPLRQGEASDTGTSQVVFQDFGLTGVSDNSQTFAPAVLDPTAAEIIDDPYPLAIGSFLSGIPPTFESGVVEGIETLTESGFANGFFECSSGNCGTDPSGSTQSPFVDGYYVARSDGLSIEFGNRAGAVGADIFGQVDSNSASAELSVRFSDDTDAQTLGSGTSLNNSSVTFGGIGLSGSDRFGTAINDSMFGINAPNQSGSDFPDSEFILASSGLVGTPFDSFFPDTHAQGSEGPVNPDPTYVRWGWWAASIQVADGGRVSGTTQGTPRTDVVRLGTWVGGPSVGTEDLPSTIVAGYEGIIAANMADLGTGAIRPVGGEFAMTYNFATNDGNFNFSIPDAGLNGLNVGIQGARGDVHFAGTQFDESIDVQLSGNFYGDPLSNPAAGTGGQIEVNDYSGGSIGLGAQTIGIFAGDQVSTEAAPPTSF